MDSKRTQSYTVHLDPATVDRLLHAYGITDPQVLFQRLAAFELHRLRFQPRAQGRTLRSVDQS